jgi:tRNA(Ile)-lysidine synthase
VRVLAARGLGDGILVAREEAAVAAPVAAYHGAMWDGRFRLVAPNGVPQDAMMGKLGDDASRFRKQSDLPSVVLRTLPAIRSGETLACVPHLGYRWHENDDRMNVLFDPRLQIAGACFVASA